MAGQTVVRTLDDVDNLLLNLSRDTLRDDDRYCGRLLIESAKLVAGSESFRRRAGGPAGGAYCGAWWKLVQEVIVAYHAEVKMLTRHLQLREYRPRTSFSVLPFGERFGETENGLMDVAEDDLRRRRLDFNRGPQAVMVDGDTPALSILLPVCNGYRKTYRTLAAIHYDISTMVQSYRVEYLIAVNFSEDDSLYEAIRFATTLPRSDGIPVSVFFVENRRRQGTDGRWRKTEMLNLFLSDIRSRYGGEYPDRHYLHFSDDDVHIAPGRSVIETNIKALEASAALVVSGVYTSEADEGFTKVSAVRKRPAYVMDRGRRLMNVYGGCMTSTVRRLAGLLEQVGEDLCFPSASDAGEFSEDVFVTVLANLDQIRRQRDGAQPGEAARLIAYGQADVLVGHGEASSPVAYARRLVRDRDWSRRAVQACSRDDEDAKEVEEACLRMRRDTFAYVTERVAQGPAVHGLAQEWLTVIQRMIRMSPARYRELSPGDCVNWDTHRTQNQLCKDIVEDSEVYAAVLSEIERGPFGRELVRALREGGQARAAAFPKASWRLVACDVARVRPFLDSQPHLYHWHRIAREAVGSALSFCEATGEPELGLSDLPLEASRLSRVFPVDLGAILSAAGIVESGTKVVPATHGDGTDLQCTRIGQASNNYSAAIWSSSNSVEPMFLKYRTVIGRYRFMRNSPRHVVYLHVLGAALMDAALNGDLPTRGDGLSRTMPTVRLLRPMFPSLASATVNYAGPERRSAFDRLMHSVHIDESVQPVNGRNLGVTVLDAARLQSTVAALAIMLGSLHGRTLGCRAHLQRAHVDGDLKRQERAALEPLTRLCVQHLDRLQLFEPATYSAWLRRSTFPGAPATWSVALDTTRHGLLGPALAKMIGNEGLTLQDIWRDLVEDSCECHDRYGAIGYLGMRPRNVFLSCAGQPWREIADGARVVFAPETAEPVSEVLLSHHSGVSLVDPAVEAGVVLAELLKTRVTSGVVAAADESSTARVMHDDSLPMVMDVFLARYRWSLDKELKVDGHRFLTLSEQEIRSIGREVLARINLVAALSLVARYHAGGEFDLDQDDRERVLRVCVDLIHGVRRSWRFTRPGEPDLAW